MDNEFQKKIIYAISHDLGAPIRAVVQFSQLLSPRLKEKLDEKEAYWFEFILNGGLKAQEMLDSLLKYSRLSTHKKDEKVFNIKDTLDRVLYTRKATTEKLNAKIDIKNNIDTFLGDEDQWYLYFASVLENALLYQKTSDLQPPRIMFNLSQTDHSIEISIEDNGIGVSEKHYKDIVLPFKRLHSEEEYPGLGMGLSYCNEIAKQHCGYVNFELSSLGGLKVVFSKKV